MGGARFLVGTREGLYRLGSGRKPALPGRDVAALAKRGTRWWALLDGRTLAESSHGSWRELGRVGRFRVTCLGAAGKELLVGTAEAHLLRLGANGPERAKSFDRVKGREEWYTPWGGAPDTRSVAGGADGALYVNVHVGGIPRSRDQGRSWQPTIDVEVDVHQVLAHPRHERLVLAATAYGLAVSEDGGDTWRLETDGLDAYYCRAVTLSGDTVLVSASRGPDGALAAVYRKPLGSDAFERCRRGLPPWFDGNVDTGWLVGAGEDVAFGTEDGRVFVSPDEGSTWHEAASGLPEIRCLAAA